jgi:hypothetical protein
LTLEREKNRVEQVALASGTLETIFNTQNISDLAVLLLNHFLILRQSDLEAWEENPEEWILEVAGDVVSAESGLRVINFNKFTYIRLLVKLCLWNLSWNIRRT